MVTTPQKHYRAFNIYLSKENIKVKKIMYYLKLRLKFILI